MGNGGSKPEQHIFSADGPVRFSQAVLDSLQKSPESDSTRAQDSEWKIQSRANSELTAIRDAGAKKLDELTSSLTTKPPSEQPAAAPAEPAEERTGIFYHLSSPFYHDPNSVQSITSEATAQQAARPDSGRSHDSVMAEIQDLRAKLDARKKVAKPSAEVEKARESLVTCLRMNDRRPLDCWEQVEQFKAEVGKLEKSFIQGVGR